MADPSQLPPLPKDHLSHPENWATGSEPATAKQKGFIKVLENQHSDLVPEGGMDVDGLGKSEASEVIEKLKAGVEVDVPGKVSGEEGEKGEEKIGRKELEDMQVDGEGKEGKGEDGQGKANGGIKRKAKDVTGSESESKSTEKDTDGKEGGSDINPDSEAVGNGEKSKPGKETAEVEKNGESGTHGVEKGESNGNGDVETKNGNGRKTEEGGKAKGDEANDEEKEGRPPKKARTSHNSTTSENNGDTDEPEPIDVDALDTEKTAKGSNDSSSDQNGKDETTSSSQNGNGTTTSAQNGNGNGETTIPGDNAHLDHPENWTTGDEPATAKQKGFLKVLEGQKGVSVGDVAELGKSEASEKIDELKNM